MKTYGHADCGVYGEVIQAGPISAAIACNHAIKP